VNPLDYCIQKATPPGSVTYYAIRQAPASRRDALIALHAFRRELSDTVLESSDPSVAQAKLEWWRRETISVAGGSPSHPVLLALIQTLPGVSRHIDALMRLLDGYGADLRQARYLDFPGLHSYLHSITADYTGWVANAALGSDADRVFARHDEATAASAAPAAPTPPSWAPRLGIALGLAAMIADIGADARHGRIYLPISEMQQFGVTAADILNRRYGDPFTALMQFQVKRAKTEISEALAAMTPRERRAQVTLRAQAAMAVRLLDEIEREGYQVLHQKIALTPVRNLLVAWWSSTRLTAW
jgi:phytoene synthase